MSCSQPIFAINLGKFNGKYKLKFLPQRVDFSIKYLEEKYGSDNIMALPCGHCSGCKISHQREWAVRCSLESSYYKENCMVTLTYRDDNRPNVLQKKDFQKFIKDLRNYGFKIRYFGCGEYGEKSGNCHFHILLFGYWPKDAKYEMTDKSGFPVYSSKFLSKTWDKGFVAISEVTPGSCAYVAGYVDKKIGKGEFVLMSKKPGIGERYIREHIVDIFKYDNLIGSFGVSKVPRYAEKIADSMFFDIEDLKKKRIENSNLNIINTMLEHRITHKEEYYKYLADKNDLRIAKRRRNLC